MIVLFTILIALSGCSNTATEETLDTVPPEVIQKLTSVEVSMYHENSTKAQPELINMYTELDNQVILDKFSQWNQSANTSVSIDDSTKNSELVEIEGKSEWFETNAIPQ